MLPNHLYNSHTFMELDFAQLQLIYVKNKLAVGTHSVYPVDTLNICLQYTDFGDYLHTINPSCEWDEHLQYMLVFCLVHVKQNFAKHFPTHKTRYIIEQIWQVETEQTLMAHMQSICTLHPELTSWINNKKTTWILARLAKEKSKVPHKWWAYA